MKDKIPIPKNMNDNTKDNLIAKSNQNLPKKVRRKEQIIRSRVMELLGYEAGKSNVSAQIQREFALSSAQLGRYLKRMELAGLIASSGYGKGKKYAVSTPLKTSTDNYPLKRTYMLSDAHKIGEDAIFQEFVAPVAFNYPKNVHAILRHCMTELINNAIDHSHGKELRLELYVKDRLLHVSIIDDGIGAFASIKKHFQLDSVLDAAAEMAKGKRTTDRNHHAGEGIYFSQRMTNEFTISANGVAYRFNRLQDDWAIKIVPEQAGTAITLTIDQFAKYSPKDIFQKYTDEDFRFVKSDSFIVLPYVLAVKGNMISRSEAKKLMAGAEEFEHVEIDFLNVDEIGQGFADEIFRVYRLQHPNIKISFRNCNKAVSMMISHVLNKSHLSR
jgi:anti-sigma regulatory factor (Ser/Thr protein kinase)